MKPGRAARTTERKNGPIDQAAPRADEQTTVPKKDALAALRESVERACRERRYAASFPLSSSALHSPLAASPFMRARWANACWAAATFSVLPDHAFCGAACSARPYEKVTDHGRSPMRLIASRCAVASSSDWPPDRNAMPGTVAGTVALSTCTVFSATSSTEARLCAFLPEITML